MAKLLFEALYYSGGFKSKLYGTDSRPEGWPATDRVGLQNDLVLADDQFVVELSRFKLTGVPAPGNPTCITWLSVIRASADVVGNRNNFCATGIWIPDSADVSTSVALDVLEKTSLHLQQNLPFDYGAPLSKSADEVFSRALKFIDDLSSEAEFPAQSGLQDGDDRTFSSQYVMTPVPASEMGNLVDAVAAVRSARTNVKASRVIFVSNRETQLDFARTESRVLRSNRDIYVHGSPALDLEAALKLERQSRSRKEQEAALLQQSILERDASLAAAEVKIRALEEANATNERLLETYTSPASASGSSTPNLTASTELAVIIEKAVNHALHHQDRSLPKGNQRQRATQWSATDREGELSAIRLQLNRIESKLQSREPSNDNLPQTDRPRRLHFLERIESWRTPTAYTILAGFAAALALVIIFRAFMRD